MKIGQSIKKNHWKLGEYSPTKYVNANAINIHWNLSEYWLNMDEYKFI
jgi:hypothetical protein